MKMWGLPEIHNFFKHYKNLDLNVFLTPMIYTADFFSKSTFSKNSLRITIRVSSNLDPDQARRYLGPNCLQRWSTDDTSNFAVC